MVVRLPLIRLCIGLLCLAGAVAVAEEGRPADLALEQARAATRLGELETRLHNLASVLREEEPDNAGRLILALQASRRDRLREEMAQLGKSLAEARTTQAKEQADALLVKLNELRELLTAADIRFRLQLERLRGMLKSAESLAALREAEERQRQQAAALAKEANAQAAKSAAEQQSQLAERTAAMAAAMASQFAGSPQSRQAVQQAEAAMRAAAGQLSNQQPAEAGEQQDRALDALQRAESQNDSDVEQLRKEMEGQVRAIVLETLKAMLGDEEAVVAASQAKRFTDESRRRQQQVADAASQLSSLVTDTAYSMALPIALNEIRVRAETLAATLAETVSEQEALAADIRSLIETIEKRPPPSPQESQQDGQGDSQQQKKKEQMEKLLAELKMLHHLESKLLKHTTDAATAKNTGAANGLRERQIRILDAVRSVQSSLREEQQ